MQDTNRAMQASLMMLQHISTESRAENNLLYRLAEQSQTDSRILKAFTTVATMYLPASLIAVSSIPYERYSTLETIS